MSGKTLSTGTLGLRFMQNARNRPSKEVQLEKVHVEDDGQWEVAKEVRESWGGGQTNQSISSETSYLPFLFPSSTTVLKGRRVFQKGREQVNSTTTNDEKAERPDSNDHEPKKGKNIATRLTMPKAGPEKPIANALLAIFDSSGVGTDLSKTATFVKPSGVDEPHGARERKHGLGAEQDGPQRKKQKE